MSAHQAAAVQYQYVQHVETAWLQQAPAADLQGNRISFEAVLKAFNMSASYATSFGSGAREQSQNWMDQCRVTVPDRQPRVHQRESAVLSTIAQQHHGISDAKSYAALNDGSSGAIRLLGVIVDCTDAAGHQLLVLKNYGAQMTLDILILGESSTRNDTALAGPDLTDTFQ